MRILAKTPCEIDHLQKDLFERKKFVKPAKRIFTKKHICQNAHCQNAHCQNAHLPKCSFAKMFICQNAHLPKCFFAKMTICQNASLQEIPCKSAPCKKYLCRVSLCLAK